MDDSEKIELTLNIGDQRIHLSVPFDRQEFARDVEADVDGLYRRWRKAFPARTDREILVMVAYQYASFYAKLREQYQAAASAAGRCLALFGPDGKDPDGDGYSDD